MTTRHLLAFLALSVPAHAGDTTPLSDLETDPGAKYADDLIVSPRAPGDWILGGGVQWRNIGEVDFRTGGTALSAPDYFGPDTFTPPPGIGPDTGYADRDYDDGFVYIDSRTAAIGRTAYYGYQSSGQQQGSNLVYTATGGSRSLVSRTSSLASTAWSDGRDWEISPYIKFSRLIERENGWSFGPAIQVGITDVGAGRGGLNTLSSNQTRDTYDVTATDSYDTSGLTLTAAPYTGSFGGTAPLIPNVPTRTLTDALSSTDTAAFSESVSESLDLNLFGISIGGEAVYQNSDQFYSVLGAGLVLNIADWDANRSDVLYQSLNGGAPVNLGSVQAGNSGTDLLWGVYVQGAAGYQINDNWSLEGNLRYDLTESLRDSVGNSSFDVDLSGWSIGLGAARRF